MLPACSLNVLSKFPEYSIRDYLVKTHDESTPKVEQLNLFQLTRNQLVISAFHRLPESREVPSERFDTKKRGISEVEK
jgi:hypothetical protein